MHPKALAAKVGSGRYVLRLPGQPVSGWNAGATAYWQHFGESIGKANEPHAITVKAQFATRIRAEELNIVTQTREASAGQGFDLVVATNVLGYYNPLEQAMAMTNIAQMLASGGIVVANNPLPPDKVQALAYLGVGHVSFIENGAGGDGVEFTRRVMARRRQ